MLIFARYIMFSEVYWHHAVRSATAMLQRAFYLLHEALDPARGPDMKEAFNVGLEMAPDDPDLLSKQPFRSLNAWPSLPDFRPAIGLAESDDYAR